MREEKTLRLVIDTEDFRLALSQHNVEFRKTLDLYRVNGFEIVLSAPSLLPSNKDESLQECIKEILELARFCDAIVFGGPKEGKNALHLDDRAVTTDEFINLAPQEINILMERP